MSDWDPFGEAAEPSGTGSTKGYTLEETFDFGGVEGRIVTRDYEKSLMSVWSQVVEEKPWDTMPDPSPNLDWHQPTCTLEDWKHTDVKCKLGVGIAHFTLNRPAEGNRLDAGILAALADIAFLLHARHDLRMAVFTGEGALFCAGGDVKGDGMGGLHAAASESAQKAVERMASRALNADAFPDGQVDVGRILETRLWHALATVPQFTVCMLNGSAMGAGVGLLACCDHVVAVESAFILVADVKHGMVPAAVAPYIVARIGPGHMKRMFCTAENVSAKGAKELCLVDEVVPDLAAAHLVVQSLCTQLTACGPRSVEAAKKLVLGVTGRPVLENLMFYTSFMAEVAANSYEAMEGTNARRAGAQTPWEKMPIQVAS